jgi:hypothetical protein
MQIAMYKDAVVPKFQKRCLDGVKSSAAACPLHTDALGVAPPHSQPLKWKDVCSEKVQMPGSMGEEALEVIHILHILWMGLMGGWGRGVVLSMLVRLIEDE